MSRVSGVLAPWSCILLCGVFITRFGPFTDSQETSDFPLGWFLIHRLSFIRCPLCRWSCLIISLFDQIAYTISRLILLFTWWLPCLIVVARFHSNSLQRCWTLITSPFFRPSHISIGLLTTASFHHSWSTISLVSIGIGSLLLSFMIKLILLLTLFLWLS